MSATNLGETPSIVNDFMYGSNVSQSHVSIRLGFLRKVYGILAAQLGLTTFVGTLIMCSGFGEFVKQNVWVMYLNMILTIVILVGLMIKRREYPANFYLLGAFTFFQSVAVGTIASFYETWTVIQAFFLTTLIVAGLTVYTMQSKRDFKPSGAMLFSLMMCLIVGGLVQIFVQSSLLHISLAVLGAFLFSAFIIYDTQMIMKHLNAEEYILGVINLYMDIINLFLEILKIIDAMKKN